MLRDIPLMRSAPWTVYSHVFQVGRRASQVARCGRLDKVLGARNAPLISVFDAILGGTSGIQAPTACQALGSMSKPQTES
jgi:hypothetical protein